MANSLDRFSLAGKVAVVTGVSKVLGCIIPPRLRMQELG